MHRVFTIEHGKAGYIADFVLYALAVLVLAVFLLVIAPYERWTEILVLVLLGLVAWTLVEYVLHRYILHGIQPFRSWHAEHHRRPRALIGTPTLLSAALIGVLVFLPALALSDLWRASALTLGLLTGYLVYAIAHHALHHWCAGNRWTRQLKRSHALHHHRVGPAVWFGVTSPIWDVVFGTCGKTMNGQRRPSLASAAVVREAEEVEVWEDEGGASACIAAVHTCAALTAPAGTTT